MEVVRRLDEDLDLCFPNMPRETFYETFRELITLPNKELQEKAIICKSNFNRGTTVHQQFKRPSANVGFDKETIETGLDYLHDESLKSKQSSKVSTWKSKNSLRLIDRDSRASVRLSTSLTDKMNFEQEAHNPEEDDDCFTIGLNEINIPFKNLDSFEIL